MSKVNGWVGVDLDGTLAEYSGWKGPTHIGAPIPMMQTRVLRWLVKGIDVRIFTARANKLQPNHDEVIAAIKAWCVEHLNQELPITCEKDFQMIQLWDDRCVQVIPNTGRRADGINDL